MSGIYSRLANDELADLLDQFLDYESLQDDDHHLIAEAAQRLRSGGGVMVTDCQVGRDMHVSAGDMFINRSRR